MVVEHFNQMTEFLKKYMNEIWSLLFSWKKDQKLEIASLAKVDSSAAAMLNDM